MSFEEEIDVVLTAVKEGQRKGFGPLNFTLVNGVWNIINVNSLGASPRSQFSTAGAKPSEIRHDRKKEKSTDIQIGTTLDTGYTARSTDESSSSEPAMVCSAVSQSSEDEGSPEENSKNSGAIIPRGLSDSGYVVFSSEVIPSDSGDTSLEISDTDTESFAESASGGEDLMSINNQFQEVSREVTIPFWDFSLIRVRFLGRVIMYPKRV
jgi:hypothetical protein